MRRQVNLWPSCSSSMSYRSAILPVKAVEWFVAFFNADNLNALNFAFVDVVVMMKDRSDAAVQLIAEDDILVIRLIQFARRILEIDEAVGGSVWIRPVLIRDKSSFDDWKAEQTSEETWTIAANFDELRMHLMVTAASEDHVIVLVEPVLSAILKPKGFGLAMAVGTNNP